MHMSEKYISIPHESGSVNISEEVIISLVQNAVNEALAKEAERKNALGLE